MLAIKTWETISGAAILALAFVGILILTGCTATPTTALYQSIGADRAIVESTTTLYQTGTIDADTARTIAESASATETGLKLWFAEIQANNKDGVTTQIGVVSKDLAALLAQLQALQANPKVAAKLRLTAKRYSAPAPAKAQVAAGQSIGDIITIIELAVQLAPQIETWVEQLFNKPTVTTEEITTAFAELDSASANLAAALQSPPTPK